MEKSRRDQLRVLLKKFGLDSSAADLDLLEQALTHKSYAAENPGTGDNERLEFLGDAVLNLACAEYLFEQYPDGSEGDLSRLRAVMVSRRVLGDLARTMGLGGLLRLGVGENASGGRERDSVVGSALEAIVGALSQSSLKWEDLRGPLRSVILEPAETQATTDEDVRGNFKSRLQEIVQRDRDGEVPTYELSEEKGPDHDKTFVVVVRVGGETMGIGRGGRIRWAENDAARRALEVLEKAGREKVKG